MHNLPNWITSFRFVAAPVLLWFAWYDYPRVFLSLLAASFLTDAIDGHIARRYRLESIFGAKLDSWADVIIYLTIPIAAWWLWPEIIQHEAPYVIVVIISYTLPALGGMIKFGVFTSYHTWGVKLAAAFMATASILLFAGGPAWPFRIAAVACVLAAVEEIVITLILPERRSNVRSFWHVLKQYRNRA